MRFIAVATAAGLVIASAPQEIGDEAFAREWGERAARSKVRATPSPGQAHDGGPRFGKPIRHAASLAPIYNQPYASGPFRRNPLVSSEHRATSEYEYLYTAAPVAVSSPPRSIYHYSADYSYLLRPGLGRGAVPIAYRWRYCMNAGLPQPSRAPTARLNRGDVATLGRDRGRTIDDALTPLMLAGHPRAISAAGAGGPAVHLVEAIPLPGWASAETHRPCVMVR